MNGIIINGELHELDATLIDIACETCSIAELCERNINNGSRPCDVVWRTIYGKDAIDTRGYCNFVNRGKVTKLETEE